MMRMRVVSPSSLFSRDQGDRLGDNLVSKGEMFTVYEGSPPLTSPTKLTLTLSLRSVSVQSFSRDESTALMTTVASWSQTGII